MSKTRRQRSGHIQGSHSSGTKRGGPHTTFIDVKPLCRLLRSAEKEPTVRRIILGKLVPLSGKRSAGALIRSAKKVEGGFEVEILGSSLKQTITIRTTSPRKTAQSLGLQFNTG